jgi:membrane fusion protein
VSEGTTVAAGAPLVAVSAETQTEARGATGEEVIRRLRDRRDSLANAKRILEAQLAQESADLAQRVEVQRSRYALSEKALARDRALKARDLISIARLQRTEQEQLDNQTSLLALESTLRDLPFRRQTRLAELDRSIAALEQELAEAEARREIVITATQAGKVTAIQAEVGSRAEPNVPLMTIVPTNAVLQAQLFASSRAIGFLHAGQRVMLRFQAYPYQKFGSYAGSISAIASSAISPSELPQPLKGLSGVYGGNEPFYRITVDLERQTAVAYGQAAPLQPGMQLEADIMIESRRLIEWVFEPLLTLTGKFRS